MGVGWGVCGCVVGVGRQWLGHQVYLDTAQVETQGDWYLHLGLKEVQNNNNILYRKYLSYLKGIAAHLEVWRANDK